MEPIVLKKSCDACTGSKVKCSGGQPCKRCMNKGMTCHYSPRKRRKRPTKRSRNVEAKVSTRKTIDPTSSADSLAEWERRSWSVFFTLYKHYGTNCSLYWFNRQLNKMRNYLKRQGNQETLDRLTSWMKALNIDINSLSAQVEQCRIKCHQYRNSLPLKISGTVKDGTGILMNNTLNPKLPTLKLTFLDTKGEMKADDEEFLIECNMAFTQVFGLEEAALTQQLRWTAGGFLPFGGDLLARLVTREKDLLEFCQILAIKFNSLTRPKSLPILREIPSCHIFEVNMKESASSGKLVPAKCLIKAVHREVITKENFKMEVVMEFNPLSNYDHLLNKAVATGQIGELSVAAYQKDLTCTLKTRVDLKPYEISKKRSHDYEDEYDSYSSIEGISPDYYVEEEDLFEEVMNSIHVEDTLPESKEQYKLEEGSFQLPKDSQIVDDWLDGLLNWANEQQLIINHAHRD